MKPLRLHMLPIAIVAALAIAAARPSPAHADSCSTATVSNGSSFNYTRCQIPDVDQFRANDSGNQVWGLPNNGSMYCVPAAAMNFMAYLANQGFPTLSPGPGDWGPEPGWPPQPHYTLMTGAIQKMGAMMGTDPVTGTTGTGALLGLAAWLTSSGVGADFVVSEYGPSGYYAPRFEDMASAVLSGSLVMAGIGRYKPGALVGSYNRHGGHVVSLAQALANPDGRSIGFRDPDSNDDPYEQSTFVTSQHPLVATPGIFNGYPRVEDRVEGYGSASFLDNYLAITPKGLIVGDAAKIYKIAPIKPHGDDAPAEPDYVSFPAADGRAVIDIALSPEGTQHPYLVAGEDTVWRIDTLTGRSTPFATVSRPRRLAFGGPDQKLFVLTEDQLVSLARDGRRVDATPLDQPLAAIAFDTKTNRLVGLTASRDQLVLYDESLRPRGSIALPSPACDGPVTIKIDPASGDVVLHCDGARMLTRIALAADGTARWREVPLEGAIAPRGLTVDDQGHTFVSDGGKLAEFNPDGRRVATSPFAGLPGGSTLDVLRSFSNFDATTMAGPAFRDGLPADAWRR